MCDEGPVLPRVIVFKSEAPPHEGIALEPRASSERRRCCTHLEHHKPGGGQAGRISIPSGIPGLGDSEHLNHDGAYEKITATAGAGGVDRSSRT